MPELDAGAGNMNASAARQPNQAQLVDEAVRWLVLMHSGHFNDLDAQRCAQWRSQSAEHQRVWESVEKLTQQLGSVPSELGMPVLNRPRAQKHRRAMLKLAATAVVGPWALWTGYRAVPWQALGAEYKTGVGERRDLTLADGSQLSINTSSAIDVAFDSAQRVILQRSGEILVQTATDGKPGGRPFIVKTEQGSMQALGTRFIVRAEDQRTRLAVMEGAVRIRPTHTQATHIVKAGEQLEFGDRAFGRTMPVPPGADQWTRGVLYAQEMRLADFVAELARYRTGILHCEQSAANMLVSGAFQLKDTDRILEALEKTLPVRIDTRTRYWVVIAAKS